MSGRFRRLPGAPAAAAAACLAVTAPAFAQDDDYPTRETLPEGVVLVVKLVSAQDVEPTTGVVVGDGGLVVVPASFVSAGDEIVVMEGGGNIARDGRRTRVAHRASDRGLVVLEVDGLSVSPPTLGFPPGDDGDELRFGAFPPARLLAAGRGPMWLPAGLSANETAGIYGLAETPRLPNVSGALFNRCEQWVGYSQPVGEPGLNAGMPPVVMFGADLKRALEDMNVAVPAGTCERPAAAAGATAGDEIADINDETPDLEPDSPAEPAAEPAVRPEEPTRDGRPAAAAETPKPTSVAVPGAEIFEPRRRALPWVLAVAVFLAIALLVLRRGPRQEEEPETIELLDGGADSRRPAADDAGRLPPGTNAWLHASAHAPDGEALDARCAVDADDFACVLGREDADLAVPHSSVSRSHLRVEARKGRMALGDLGSTNGTAVSGARCLPGEIVYVDEDQVIGLGELRLSLRLERAGEGSP